MDDLVGRIIGPGGKYRLVKALARGGMATVYQAEQLNVPRQVAIKIADPDLVSQPAFVRRFRQEIGAVALLEHEPHILPVYDVGEDGGLLYMVMPLVTGGSLREQLERRRGAPWPPDEVWHIAQQVLSALAYAHEHGLIHRDIKPSNVLMEGRRIYLADFGIAKLRQETGTAPVGLTLTGTALMGTPTYMAPEQALGQLVDRRADLYSLGVMLYELFTGRVPYEGQTPMEMAFRHVEASLPPPRLVNPALSAEIEAVLLKALARQPDARYASASEFSAALDRAISAAAARTAVVVAVHPVPAPDLTPPDLSGPLADGVAGVPPGVDPPRDDAGRESALDAEAAALRDQQFLLFEQELLRRLELVVGEQSRREQQLWTPASVRPDTAEDQARREQESREFASQMERQRAERERLAQEKAAQQVAQERADRERAEQMERERTERLERKRLEDERREREPLQRAERDRQQREKSTPHRSDVWSTISPLARRRLLRGGAAVASVGVLAALATRFVPSPQTRVTPTAAPATPTVPPPTPRAGVYSADPPAPLLTARVGHTATLLDSGLVLVVGGHGPTGYLASCELYDPFANHWTAASPLSRARSGHVAVALADGQVLVAGGQDGDTSYLGSCELYDPAANRWSTVEPLGSARADHTGTLLTDGRVVVVGGLNDSQYHATADFYDPREKRWRPAGRLEVVRKGHAAALVSGGQVLVTGGNDATSYLASSELFDPAANRWTAAAPLAVPREGHTASTLKNGQVLVAGGLHGASGGVTVGFVLPPQTERFDPQQRRWLPAGSLSQGRVAHTATILETGDVLVAGGQGLEPIPSDLTSTELYGAGSNAWRTAAPLSQPRAGHAAVLLKNGQVLVTGGQAGGQRLLYVERYDAPADKWTSAR